MPRGPDLGGVRLVGGTDEFPDFPPLLSHRELCPRTAPAHLSAPTQPIAARQGMSGLHFNLCLLHSSAVTLDPCPGTFAFSTVVYFFFWFCVLLCVSGYIHIVHLCCVICLFFFNHFNLNPHVYFCASSSGVHSEECLHNT